MIYKIENNSGIAFKIIYKDMIVDMSLVLLEKKSYFDKSYRYEYGYMNKKNTLYTRSIYCGGNTGFGSSDIRPVTKAWHDEYKIVTKDIVKINRIAKMEEAKVKRAKTMYNRKMSKLAERINDVLPRKFKTLIPELDEAGWRFTRSNAEFNPSYSSSIRGGEINLVSSDGHDIWLDFYCTKKMDKLLGIKFNKLKSYLFQGLLNKKDSREVLTALVARQKELTAQVKNIKA